MTFWERKVWAREARFQARLLVSGHLKPWNSLEKSILLANLFTNPSR